MHPCPSRGVHICVDRMTDWLQPNTAICGRVWVPSWHWRHAWATGVRGAPPSPPDMSASRPRARSPCVLCVCMCVPALQVAV